MDFPYTLIRSSRKTIALVIDPRRWLIVRAPRLYPRYLIDRFVESKSNWIKKHRDRVQERRSPDPTSEDIAKMKHDLSAYLIPRVREIWQQHDLPAYSSIKITKSERRWGSCSGKNGFCFSYRLAEYLDGKTDFIDAIICHELAHLREKNHQKPFWDLVQHLMPEYQDVMKKYKN